MDVAVSRSSVRGEAAAPPSKSYTHRAILAAGYADGATVHGPLRSADTRATMRAVEAFGGAVSEAGTTLRVEGFDGRPAVPADVLDCANSGTTMRLVTATAALADGITVLTGDASLRSRPQGPLLEAIDTLGGRAESTRGDGRAPLVIRGPIEGGHVALPGDVSSQFVSALLMAGGVTSRGIEVELTTRLKSAPYVDITIEVLDRFGVEARRTSAGFAVDGGQRYDPGDPGYRVPGDFSSMSYLLAAGAVAGDGPVVVTGAHPSVQGDRVIVDHLERMGASVDWNESNGEIAVEPAPLRGIEVDVGDTPDLLPTLAAVGACADGETRLVNCEHVRYKETDRVSVMAEELGKLGAIVEEHPDELVVRGGEGELRGVTVEGHGDHRVVMALAVAGLVAEGTTTIRGAEHVDVSFPGFFDVLEDLGASIRQP